MVKSYGLRVTGYELRVTSYGFALPFALCPLPFALQSSNHPIIQPSALCEQAEGNHPILPLLPLPPALEWIEFTHCSLVRKNSCTYLSDILNGKESFGIKLLDN